MAGIGLAVPAMLPLEIAAIVCGCMGACVKLVRRKLMSKAQKHYEIKTVPAMLPLEIAAIVCGCMGACVKLVRRKLMSKAQKHYEIKTIGESKLNSVKNLISKALNDGQISTEEFQLVLCELDRYNDLKDKTHTKQSGLSEQEKKKLIEEGKAQALALFKKKISDT